MGITEIIGLFMASGTSRLLSLTSVLYVLSDDAWAVSYGGRISTNLAWSLGWCVKDVCDNVGGGITTGAAVLLLFTVCAPVL